MKNLNGLANYAFTLTEVLIALAIIGIVAAITIPTLIHKFQERILITQLKNAYAIFNNATQMVAISEGSWKNLDIGTGGKPKDALKIQKLYEPFLKISENCGTDTGCFADVIYALDGKTPYVFQSKTQDSYSRIRLQNGMSVAFWSNGSGCPDNSCGSIIIDINGEKKPNTAGKDAFTFVINSKSNNIHPMGERGEINPYRQICEENSNSAYNGMMCTARVLEREKFDYSPWAEEE